MLEGGGKNALVEGESKEQEGEDEGKEEGGGRQIIKNCMKKQDFGEEKKGALHHSCDGQ